MLTMMKIGIITENTQEAQLLKQAFAPKGFSVVIIPIEDPPNHFGIMKSKPDIILIDIPKNYVLQFGTIQKIRGNKLVSQIPIIAYGTHSDDEFINKITHLGILKYIIRPLKVSVLLNIFEVIQNAKNNAVSKSNMTLEEKRKSDISILTDPEVISGKKIGIMSELTENLLAFPFSIAKIVELTGSDQSSADDLANVIKSDPGISANIIKSANSISYAGRSQVSNFKEENPMARPS